MNIFITGINSFIGKELVKLLKLNPKFKLFGCDLHKSANPKYFKADIKKRSFYKKISKNIDIMIHLAAISRDQDCIKDPYKCYHTNVNGTLNVLEACKKLKIKKIIFASTEWVYPDRLAKKSPNEYSQIDITQLKSDYAKSKFISEINLKSFYDSNKNYDVSILRFGIVYGERLSHWSAVEKIFYKIKNSSVVKIGSLRTTRRFIHVTDICSGIIKSFNLKKFNIINLQGKEKISLKKLINISQSILNKKIKVIEINKKNSSVRNIRSKKTYKKINFKSKILLKEGLHRFNNFLNNTLN
jgi:UDP-glucose 4-epimerase